MSATGISHLKIKGQTKRMFKQTIFLIVLLACETGAKRGGGGLFQSRGQSGARQGGGFHPQQPSGGGFHPQQPAHPSGGFRPGPANGGFHQPPPVSGFRSGVGPGSVNSGSALKHALIGGAIGAAGGIIAYEAGKAIIHSATSPFSYGGRSYYWDNHYQNRPGQSMCSISIDSLQKLQGDGSTTTTTTTTSPSGGNSTTVAPLSTTANPNDLSKLQFADGSRPYRITWSCRTGIEKCCGTECCKVEAQAAPPGTQTTINVGGIILIVLLILLLIGCCCCFLVYKMCRETLDCILPREHKHYDDGAYQMNHYQTDAYPAQPQGYAQGYSSGYPPNTYPTQPAYNQQGAYPSQPYYR